MSSLAIACRIQVCTYESLTKPTLCIKICYGKGCNSDVSLSLYSVSAPFSWVKLCWDWKTGETLWTWGGHGGGSFKYYWSLSTLTIRINHPGLALSRTHQQTVCEIRMFAFCVDPGLHITLCLDQTHGGEHDSRWEIFLTVYGLGMWWFVPHITLNTKRPWGWSASHL